MNASPFQRQLQSLVPFAQAFLLVAVVTGFAMTMSGRLSLTNVALFYLLPVMIASLRGGLLPGLFAGLLAVFAYNFFLLPPLFTLRVANPDHFVTILILFAVAAVTSQLASRLRREVGRAQESAGTQALLAQFAREVAAAEDEPAIIAMAVEQIETVFAAQAALFLSTPQGLTLAGGAPDLNSIDSAARDWAFEHGDRTGRGTAIMTSADWLFVPLLSGGQKIGAVGVSKEDATQPVLPERTDLFMGLVGETGQAIGRYRLAAQQGEVDRLRERDELRAALLSSVSHDLRTPLTVIVGEVEALRRGNAGSVERLAEEAYRLDRLIGNLLDMARIEAGAIQLASEPVDLVDAVDAAIEDSRGPLADRHVVVEIDPALPLVRADPQLLHHVLINLINNAAKYGGYSSTVTIMGRPEDGAVALRILDEGPGIPAGEEQAIFQRFTRISGSDRVGGTGLGLAIVAGFGKAMGMEIAASNREDRSGSCFTLRFPTSLLIMPMEAAQ